MNQKKLEPKLGQHLLTDTAVAEKIAAAIPKDSVIVEIGAGEGFLTKELVKKAKEVLAIEIDPKFQPNLLKLRQAHKNLHVEVADAIKVLENMSESTDPAGAWLAGSIPYHITEPLMMNIIRIPIEGAVFLTGATFANEITEEKDSGKFGKLTLLANTFFEIEVLDHVKKEAFNPPPRTTSAIVLLKPKQEKSFLTNPSAFIFRELFLSSSRGALVKNVLRESLIRYSEALGKTPMTKRQATEAIRDFDLDERLLEKSVEQLNNDEFKVLAEKL